MKEKVNKGNTSFFLFSIFSVSILFNIYPTSFIFTDEEREITKKEDRKFIKSRTPEIGKVKEI